MISPAVAYAIDQDRLRASRARAWSSDRPARPPSRSRRSAAQAIARMARRLDADSARRTIAA
jgi:hypothetical protein